MALLAHTTEISLGLSFFLGLLHALEPGHGKTAMLVYLTDKKHNYWHPLILGLSTAFSHSVSLLLIAFAVHAAHLWVTGTHHDHNHPISDWLQTISALLIVVVGIVMFWQASYFAKHHCCSGACKLKTQASTKIVELGSSAAVAIDEQLPATGNYRTTALLGLAVGLIPCPSALAAYLCGLSSGQPQNAYSIILLFAAGIAVSLACTGYLLQRFGSYYSARWKSESHIPWAYIRASVILFIGFFYMVHIFL